MCNRLYRAGILSVQQKGRSRMFKLTNDARAQLVVRNDGASHSWSVSRSYQSPDLISTTCSVGNDILISCGLEIILLDEETNQRWKRSLPFRVHSAAHASGKIGVLLGHGFHLLRASDGSQIGEGRSTTGGFSDIMHWWRMGSIPS